MYKLILASESPRRRQLLQSAGFVFAVNPIKVSEIPNKNLNVSEQILDIARRKSTAAFVHLLATQTEPFVVLSADTEVIYNAAPMGKPADKDDAFRMLKLLSGKTHQVITALSLIESREKNELTHIETTQVVFKELSDALIRDYIATGEPMDKAGAYGIQGQGRELVCEFIGSFENVVGLPVAALQSLLQKNNWKIKS